MEIRLREMMFVKLQVKCMLLLGHQQIFRVLLRGVESIQTIHQLSDTVPPSLSFKCPEAVEA